MRKKWIPILLIFCFLLSALSACGKKEKHSEYVLYDLNADRTDFLQEDYTPTQTGAKDMAEEMLSALSADHSNGNKLRPIPSEVSIQSVKMNPESGLLTISFSRAYGNLTGAEEAMTRAAIVKTLLQIRGVTMVDFQIEGIELVDGNGNVVGAMDENSFVDGMTSQYSPKNTTELMLYYPSADGASLVAKKQKITYSSNVPVYRVALNYLQKKPKDSDLHPAFPSASKVLSMTVADSICYLNFDSSFRTSNPNVPLKTAIYSIVDTLTELASIKGVQISINGENVSLSDDNDNGVIFHRDMTLVQENKDGQ